MTLVEKKLDEKKIENDNSNKDINKKNSNVIETLNVSAKFAGNTYTINADTAKFEKNKADDAIL